MSRSTLFRLSDDQLIRNLDQLVSTERTRLVDVLNHLNEIDERRLHHKLGFRSLFSYCTEHLKYSESAAGRRIAVARVLRHTPEVGPMLTSGDANLTTLAMVAGLLNPATKRTLLARIRGKSRRGVERIVAEYRPRKVVRDRVRAVCLAQPIAPATTPGLLPIAPATLPCLLPIDVVNASGAKPSSGSDETAGDGGVSGAPSSAAPEDACSDNPRGSSRGSGEGSNPRRANDEDPELRNRADSAHPLRRYEIAFVAGEEFMQKLDRARVLLSNKRSTATFEQVFDAAIEVFLEARCPIRRDRRRKKKRMTRRGAAGRDNVRVSLPPAGAKRQKGNAGRHIPAAVHDAVHARDQGRCTFVGPDGNRCRARRFLEIDHVEPYALGGTHTMSNLRLLCGAHNRLFAERVFGRDTMDKYAQRIP